MVDSGFIGGGSSGVVVVVIVVVVVGIESSELKGKNCQLHSKRNIRFVKTTLKRLDNFDVTKRSDLP